MTDTYIWRRWEPLDYMAHEGPKDLFLTSGTEMHDTRASLRKIDEDGDVPLFWRPSPQYRMPKPAYESFVTTTDTPSDGDVASHVEKMRDAIADELGHTGESDCPRCEKDKAEARRPEYNIDERIPQTRATFETVMVTPHAMDFCRYVAAVITVMSSGAESEDEEVMANANAMIFMTGALDGHPLVSMTAFAVSSMIEHDQDFRSFFEVLKQPRPHDFNLKVLTGQLRAVHGLRVVRVENQSGEGKAN